MTTFVAVPPPVRTWDERCASSPRLRAVLVGVVLVTGALSTATQPDPLLRVVDGVVTLVAAALVLLMTGRPPDGRTDRLVVAIGLLAAASGTATPAASFGVVGVAQGRPLRRALLVTGASVLGHLVLGAWRGVPHLVWGWWAFVVVAVHAALLGWGRSGRAHAQLVASLRARAEAAEAEQARRVAEARAAERTRIAREMHDVLAHRLSLLATWAGALEYRADAPPDQLARAAGVVRDGVHRALEELREVIGVLRADDLPGGPPSDGDRPVPGAHDVVRLVEEARAAGEPVGLDVDLDLDAVPRGVGPTVYRVVQEGLTNARRHAPGAEVRVGVTGVAGGDVVVEVVNALARVPAGAGAGAGAPASSGPGTSGTGLPAGSGTGLVGLRERAGLLGGRLAHGADGDVFRLVARIPWRA